MNVEVTFTTTIEVSDSLLSLTGKSVDDFVSDLIESADLPDFLADAEVTVSGAESTVQSRSGMTTRQVARAAGITPVKPSTPRPARVATPSTDDDGEPKRSGRPPFKVDDDGTRWEASDGGSVTEWGNRSVQSLKEQGIACRRVGASAWPKWYERTMESAETDDETEDTPARPVRKNLSSPVKADAPVMRSRTRK